MTPEIKRRLVYVYGAALDSDVAVRFEYDEGFAIGFKTRIGIGGYFLINNTEKVEFQPDFRSEIFCVN